MKALIILTATVAATGLVPGIALAHLPVGATAPAVRTQGALAGRIVPVNLREALRKGPVVLYFYPAAYSAGCDMQAREFSEAADRFAHEGATVIGMSADPIDKLQKYSAEKCGGKFTVAAATPAAIRAFDVAFRAPPGLSPEMLAQAASRTDRTTYVIAPDGKVAFAYSSLNPRGHVEQSLQAVRAWRAAHPIRK